MALQFRLEKREILNEKKKKNSFGFLFLRRLSFYYVALVPSGAVKLPWKSIWKLWVPSRVAFFVWTASLGKILTADNLRKNIILVSWCCNYKKDMEMGPYMLLHCSFARELWDMVLGPFGVHWVVP